jgi:hypothetical protein
MIVDGQYGAREGREERERVRERERECERERERERERETKSVRDCMCGRKQTKTLRKAEEIIV